MFWDAFVNVLAIIAIVGVTAFILVFIVDLLLSIWDNKHGIFFRGRRRVYHYEDEKAPAKELELSQQEELKQLQDLYRNKYIGGEPQTAAITEIAASNSVMKNGVNYKQAAEEEKILNSKYSFDNISAINAPVPEEEKGMSKADIFEEVDDITDEVLAKYEKNKSNSEKINDFSKELDKYSINKVETKKPIFEPIFEPIVEEDEEDDDILEPIEVVKAPIKNVVLDNIDELENMKKSHNKEKEKLVIEMEKLQKALDDERNKKAQVDTTSASIYSSAQACVDRIDILEERLNVAKKALKVNDKEYNPLFKVCANLAKYKDKLRRKEMMVTRQRVALYGVNNFVDIDKERAEKLSNDIELLDGLRLSVQDCENVINNSKERYPVLEKTNTILRTDIANIESDLEDTKKVLASFNSEDDGDEE